MQGDRRRQPRRGRQSRRQRLRRGGVPAGGGHPLYLRAGSLRAGGALPDAAGANGPGHGGAGVRHEFSTASSTIACMGQHIRYN